MNVDCMCNEGGAGGVVWEYHLLSACMNASGHISVCGPPLYVLFMLDGYLLLHCGVPVCSDTISR